MEITRSGILRDCLEEANREMLKYSRHNAGLLPLEGYENHFADLSAKCAMLRAMILEAESREEETKSDEPRGTRPLAQWQKELMDQTYQRKNWEWNPVTMTWEAEGNEVAQADVAGMTPDEAILRRRYRNVMNTEIVDNGFFKTDPLEGWKPGPVVYPGGEDDGTV